MRNGTVTVLASVSVGIPTSGTLRFEVQGTHLRLYVNDVLRVQKDNTALQRAGRIGIAANAAKVSFSQVAARLL